MAEFLKLKVLFDGEEARRKINKFSGELDGTIKRAEGASKSFNEFQGRLLGIGANFASVAAIIAAEKKVFDFAREGASVLTLERQFERMSAEVGTTAEALDDDLRKATKGLVGEFGRMQQANDFLRLGLVDTREDLIRLVGASAELGFDLGEVTLALANQSKRRFDQLGLSLDGFNEKLEALKAQGLDTDDAFTEAFLQQAEEQVERVGSLADTTEGEFRQWDATVEDFNTTLKEFAAIQIGPRLANLNDLLAGNVAETDTLVGSMFRLSDRYRIMLGLTPLFTDEQHELTEQTKELAGAAADADRNFSQYVDNTTGGGLYEISDLVQGLEQDWREMGGARSGALDPQPFRDERQAILDNLEARQLLMQGPDQAAEFGFATAETIDQTQFSGVEAKLAGLVSGETFNAEGGTEALGQIQSAVEGVGDAAGAIQPDWFGDPRNDIDYIKGKLDEMDGTTINIDIIETIRRENEGERQHGGGVARNLPYLVGEQGPELFVPHTNGQVFPNAVFNMNNSFPQDTDGRAMLDSFVRQVRRL